MSFSDDLRSYLRAGYPAIWVNTFEEERCFLDVDRVVGEEGMVAYRWRMTKGWAVIDNGETMINDTIIPSEALVNILDFPEEGIYVFMNFHFFIEQPDVIQTIKDILPIAKATGRHLVFVSATVTIPVELEKDIVLIEYSLPTKDDLSLVLDGITEVTGLRVQDRDDLLNAALGLAIQEAENAFALAAVRCKALNKDAAQVVQQEKVNTVKKSGLLEFYPAEKGGLNSVGGLNNLKQWLLKRQKAFSAKAREMHLRMPKGVLLAGVPGVGKTLTAKAVARTWGWPLLRLDIGRMFGSLVGDSEKNMRNALKLAEAIAPCVLVIDEMEKGISGVNSSGATDSGVTARVIGELLTWMNDKEAPIFVVATVNRVEGLPPEILRRGRFDGFFFCDLPTPEERKEIFNIHLLKRGIELWDDTWIELSKDFSGAEIEQAIEDALLEALNEDRDLKEEDITFAIKQIIPLATTMQDDITKLREWAKFRAQPAGRAIQSVELNNKRRITKPAP